MRKPLLYILDDDASIRRAIQRVLSTAGYTVHGCGTADEFFEVCDDGGPSCLVLDLCMPEVSGLDILERLEQQRSPIGVVFLSGYGDVPSTVEAMKHGALDFLTKPVNEQALLAAVSAALERSTAACAARQEQLELRNRFDSLTPREREVCTLVAEGYLNKQTAFELGTAEKTVKVHRARVMSKLQVSSVAELVRLVDNLGVKIGASVTQTSATVYPWVDRGLSSGAGTAHRPKSN